MNQTRELSPSEQDAAQYLLRTLTGLEPDEWAAWWRLLSDGEQSPLLSSEESMLLTMRNFWERMRDRLSTAVEA